MNELIAIVLYFSLLVLIGLFSYRKNFSSSDFMIGNRSLNSWLTALSAHASDMSSWLFMGYPAAIFTAGLFRAWAALGLIFFMWLNWKLVAPKIRTATEKYNSVTLSSFFESRLSDTSGRIRLATGCMSLVFYTIYISAALVGLGILLETLFGIPYNAGIFIGMVIVVPYVFIGGYLTLAWIDLFQGFFLLGVIVAVPIFLMTKIGGSGVMMEAVRLRGLTTSLLPDLSPKTFWMVLCEGAGWGLGYFGQPHIITKFMGIRKVGDIEKSKWIGMSWMVLSLGAATLVGLVAISYFGSKSQNAEQIFITMVKENFSPFLIGIILCGVLATTINAMSSQVLVLSSTLTEDFYKKIFHKEASSRQLLLVSRLGIVLVTLLSFLIAYAKVSTIYSLVQYAWSGLGASFGPLVLLSLYGKNINKYGAWTGIFLGGITSALWPYCNLAFAKDVPTLLPAFGLSFASIVIVSWLTKERVIEERA